MAAALPWLLSTVVDRLEEEDVWGKRMEHGTGRKQGGMVTLATAGICLMV